MTGERIGSIQIAENAAFALERAIKGPPIPVRDLAAFSQRLISEALDSEPDAEEIDPRSWESQNRRKLDVAARVSASIASSGVDEENAPWLFALATLSFCLDGNFVSGRLVAKHLPGLSHVPEAVLVAVGVGCPLVANELRSTEGLSELGGKVLEASWARISLPAAEADSLVDLTVRYERTYRVAGSGHLFSLALKSSERALELRFDQILASRDFPLKSEILSGLIRCGRFLALPSQRDALLADGFFDRARPTLVSLPTGSGKTLVGLLGLASSLEHPHAVGVFLAPYLAVRRQVADAARALFGSSVTVVTGGRLEGTGRRVIIDTPEGFDARIRRNPQLLDAISGIVLDEAHLLGAEGRGLTADGVLTRVFLRRRATPPKLSLLSAVLDDDTALRDWMDQWGAGAAAPSRWRPAARRFGRWRQDGTLEWLRTIGIGLDQAKVFKVAQGRIEPPFPQLSYANPLAGAGPRWDECDANVALLATALWRGDGKCTLIIGSSRRRARTIAKAVAARLPDRGTGVGACVATLAETVRRDFPEFEELVTLCNKGVAYHSAALPLQLRSLIEEACDRRELDFVVATTSLAEGSDLPFGRTILADWTFNFGNGQFIPFRPWLWRNIAGRCGRPSSFIEGETIIVEVTPHTASWSFETRAKRFHEMLVGRVELDTPLDPGAIERAPVVEQLLSQTLAAIDEVPDAENAVSGLLGALVAARTAEQGTVGSMAGMIEARLLGGAQPLATKNSPIRLTSKGKAICRCPVLPESAELIVRAFEGLDATLNAAEVCGRLLRATAFSRELQSTDLAKIAVGKTVRYLWVGSGDFEVIAQEWLGGANVRTLMLRLGARHSRKKPRQIAELAAWLQGNGQGEEWRPYYEKLFDHIRSVYSGFLPRALVSAEILQSHDLISRGIGNLAEIRSKAFAAARSLVDGGDLDLSVIDEPNSPDSELGLQ